MKLTIKLEGFRDLDAGLGDLPKATAKNTMRRVLMKAAQPIADEAARLAPELSGELKESIDASTVLSPRQKAQNRRNPSKSYVEVYAGAGPHPQAHLREFGRDHHPADPFLRPAWEGGKQGALDGIKDDLSEEIQKSATRIAKKQASLIAKTGR